MAFLDLFDRAFGKVRLIPVSVIEVHVVYEPAREKLIRQALVALEIGLFAFLASGRAPAQVYLEANACAVHNADRAGEVFRGVIDVLMQIDNAPMGAPLIRQAANAVRIGRLRGVAAQERGAGEKYREDAGRKSWFHGKRHQLMPGAAGPQVRPVRICASWIEILGGS